MRRFSWLDIVIILSFLLLVYFILTRIFGNSASDLSIMVSLVIFIGSLLSRLMFIVFDLNRELGEFKAKSVNSFKGIREDMDILKGDIGLIKNKLKI